jgi:hypothetical protein
MRTVFVIGAGANVEIGMPSGNELKTKIAELLDITQGKNSREYGGDALILEAILKHVQGNNIYVNQLDAQKFINAAVNISKAMPFSISIDSFIETRKDDNRVAFCGKLAIVRAILQAEQKCSLFDAYNNDVCRGSVAWEKIELLHNSWYPLLWEKITEGCPVDGLPARFNDISFIIFNYDRCFEYFMYNTLMVNYNMNEEEAENFVRHLHINHPYGTVGDIWDGEGGFAFGETPNEKRLTSAAKKIKTFTESIDREKDSDNRIQYLMERANVIIFLGFAYHEQNLDLLFNHPGGLYVMDGVPLSENTACYGTGHGISENDLKYIRAELEAKDRINGGVDISPVTCSNFFREFWYRLSFKTV